MPQEAAGGAGGVTSAGKYGIKMPPWQAIGKQLASSRFQDMAKQ